MCRIGIDRGSLCFDGSHACMAGLSAPCALPASDGAGRVSLVGGIYGCVRSTYLGRGEGGGEGRDMLATLKEIAGVFR